MLLNINRPLKVCTIPELIHKMNFYLERYEHFKVQYANSYHPDHGLTCQASDFKHDKDMAIRQGRKVMREYMNRGYDYYDYRLIQDNI